MIQSAFDFADSVGGVLQEMQAVRDAETEAAIIEAKIRGASDEEIAQIKPPAERERRYAWVKCCCNKEWPLPTLLRALVPPPPQRDRRTLCWRLYCDHGWCRGCRFAQVSQL